MDRKTRRQDVTTLWLMALCYVPVAITVAFTLRPSQSPVYQLTGPAMAVLALGLALVATVVAAQAISHDSPVIKERAVRRLARCLVVSAMVMTLTVAASLITAIVGI